MVWILFAVANFIGKFIINARFYHRINHVTLLKKEKYTRPNYTPTYVSYITPGSPIQSEWNCRYQFFVAGSSVVNCGYQDNFNPVYFFFIFIYLFIYFFDEKISRTQKHVTPRSSCTRENLLPLLFSASLFLFCLLIYARDVFLCAQNLFVRKK